MELIAVIELYIGASAATQTRRVALARLALARLTSKMAEAIVQASYLPRSSPEVAKMVKMTSGGICRGRQIKTSAEGSVTWRNETVSDHSTTSILYTGASSSIIPNMRHLMVNEKNKNLRNPCRAQTYVTKTQKMVTTQAGRVVA